MVCHILTAMPLLAGAYLIFWRKFQLLIVLLLHATTRILVLFDYGDWKVVLIYEFFLFARVSMKCKIPLFVYSFSLKTAKNMGFSMLCSMLMCVCRILMSLSVLTRSFVLAARRHFLLLSLKP